jgi:1D-myo-inositol 3-kinase
MPATVLQPARAEPPAFLSIGHITRDVLPDGSFALGGTVTFATLTVERLGLPAALVTCASADICQQLPSLLPGIGLAARMAARTTTFENRYQDGFRIQYLRARSEPLEIEDVPLPWRAAPIVLLAPLAQELTPEIVALFPRSEGRILAATPQGWLRRWDSDGRVWPTPWEAAEQVLPHLDALILSHDDLLPFANGSRAEAEAILRRWSQLVPLLVATAGREGATLFRKGLAQHFPAYPAREVDPTGAGDVFAAAFLVQLARSGDPVAAVDFANCVASFSVEDVGTRGIPSPTQVEKRLAQRRGSEAG